MEVDGEYIARVHSGQFKILAGGVGAGEIEAHVVSQHEAHDGQAKIYVGADTDADDDGRRGFQNRKGSRVMVEHGDPNDLRTCVAVTMVDGRDGFDDVG